MGKNKKIVVEDAYEETVPSSCSSCNLAIKYTVVVLIVGLVFISLIFIHYDNEPDIHTLSTSQHQVEDDIKMEKISYDKDFLTRMKDMFQIRERREMIPNHLDDGVKSSFFTYLQEKAADECKASDSEPKAMTKKRKKRNIFSTPQTKYNSDFIKEERRAEEHLLEVQHQYFRCKREAGPKAPEKCNSISLEFEKLTKEVNEKFHQFKMDNFNNLPTTTITDNNGASKVKIKESDKSSKNQGVKVPEQAKELPYLSKNNENVGQIFFGDGFYSYTYDQIPRIHEDLNNNFSPKRTSNTLSKSQSRNGPQFNQFQQPPAPPPPETPEIKLNKEDQAKNIKAQEPIAVSGPFLSLCDQIARQNTPNNIPIVPPTGVSYFNGPQFQTIHQFSGRGPVTAETVKSSAVLLQNPGYSFSTNPVCFYPSQPVQQFRMPQQVITVQPQYVPHAGAFAVHIKNHIEPRVHDKGFVYVPTNTAPIGSQVVQQGVPDQGTITRVNQPGNQPMYCTYLPSELPQVIRPGHYRSNDDDDFTNNEDERAFNIPSDTDIIYASYANQLIAFTNRTIASMQDVCEEGFMGCFGSNQCIPKSKWCDSNVDCLDSSDESACSCKSRLSVDKICDGYIDCPMGSDEIGCFGCDKFSYSCYTTADDFNEAKHSSLMMCYNRNEKCDGVENCLNGRDEEDCNMITRTVGEQLSYMVSYTEGYLHRNYKGVWYPVCENPLKWARQACEAESGPLQGDPVITFLSGSLPGPYIRPTLKQTDIESELEPPQLIDSCPAGINKKNVVLYVKCPPMRCGLPKINEFKSGLRVRDRRYRAVSRDKRTDDRVVGGTDVEPLKWPFIVGMYRNGNFHCGGVIHTESWIITAAHCISQYHLHYYEIRAGILRRFSYSPTSQTVKVAYVVEHENYNRKDMINDLALLKLESPLVFNRWVKPICLPAPGRTAMLDAGDKWIWGPAEGTLCKAVGWGAVREKGPDPDHLREVSVPILSTCKHRQDREGEEICAGDKDGGRDACQGDSGGPLFCQSVGNPNEWYLAGIVSHGEGCARPDEPGVYTRLALFLDWIMMVQRTVLTKKPAQVCPGYRCVWGGGLCIPKAKRCDQIVDCLGGEDEVRCGFRSFMNDMVGQNVTNDVESKDVENDEDEGRKDIKQDGATIESKDVEKDEGEGRKDIKQDGATVEDDVRKDDLIDTLDDVVINEGKFELPKIPKLPELPPLKPPPPTTELPTPEPTTLHPPPPPEPTTLPPPPPPEPPTLPPLKPPPPLPKPPKPELPSLPPLKPPPPPPTLPPMKPPPPPPTLPPLKPPPPLPVLPKPELPPLKPTVAPTTPPIETTTPTFISPPVPIFIGEDKFICTKIHQKIHIDNRCDMVSDCEDGTDEVGCSCREYLKQHHSDRICDGKVDCVDLTDEKGCLICSEEEYSCLISKTCIPKHLRCDDQFDCESKEDELDCFALCDGKTVLLDANLRPILNYKGIVAKNSHGEWNVMCSDTIDLIENGAETAGQICSILGFSGYSYFNLTKIESDSIETKIRKIRHTTDPNEIESKFEQVGNPHQCTALYVECVPHSNAFKPHEDYTDYKTISSLIPALKPPIKPATSDDSNRPQQPPKPILPPIFEIPKPFPIKPITQPDKKPLVVVTDTKHPIKSETTEDRHWPWSADVYVEGRLVCVGILLDNSWVLTEGSCLTSVNLEFDYVAVVVGKSQAFMNIIGPYEQIVRVSCMVRMEGIDSVLLFMEHTVRFNRECLPTFLPQKIDLKNTGECFALSHNKFGKMVTLPLIESEKECFDGHKCFRNGRRDHSNSDLHCDDDEVTRCGSIMCSLSSVGFYPTAFYTSRRGLCAFDKIFPVPTLEAYYDAILFVIDNQPNYCSKIHKPPVCSGHRCLLGACLKKEQICNGRFDCHDGSDETDDLCNNRGGECAFSDLKCDNGKCISKAKFCDHVNDCGDLTDEPAECSCYTYYNVTDSTKICDGVRNCWDKSDENPAICSCRDNTFKCGSSTKCVPNDFVCDNEKDCPSGEDEQFCYGLEYPKEYHDGYGRVIQQSFGIWHTKCFPKPHLPTDEDVAEICNELGYQQSNPSFRVIDDNSSSARSSPDKNSTGPRYRFEPTKAAVVNKFTPLRVNSQLTLYVKPSRPIAKLVSWDRTDDEKCFRLEISCE